MPETPAGARSPIERLCRKGHPRRTRRWDKGDPDYVAEFGLRAEHIPTLIDLACEWAEGERAEDDVLFAPIHAWRALGQLRAAEAVEPLLEIQDSLDAIGDDWYLEEFHDIFGLVGPPAIATLARYLADRSRGEFPRISSANGLREVGRRHPQARQRVVQVLATQLGRCEPDVGSLNGFLVGYLVDLRAAESAGVIERAYAARVVDQLVCGPWTKIREELGVPERGLVPERPEPTRRSGLPQLSAPPGWTPPPPRTREPKKHRQAKSKRKQQKQARKRNRKQR